MKPKHRDRFFRWLIIFLTVLIIIQILFDGVYLYFQREISTGIQGLARYYDSLSFHTARYFYTEGEFKSALLNEGESENLSPNSYERFRFTVFELERFQGRLGSIDQDILNYLSSPRYLIVEFQTRYGQIETVLPRMVDRGKTLLETTRIPRADALEYLSDLEPLDTLFRQFIDTHTRIDDFQLNAIRDFLSRIFIILSILITLVLGIILIGGMSIYFAAKQRETERAQLVALNNKLAHTLTNLRSTQDELVEARKLSAMGHMIAGMAHELNTPLGVAITATSAAFERSEHIRKMVANLPGAVEWIGQSREMLNVSMDNLQRAAGLIDSFKNMGMDGAGSVPRLLDLKELLEQILQSFKSQFQKKGIEYQISGGDDTIIRSRPEAILQVIGELVNNSLFHALSDREDGRISLDLQRVDNWIRLHFHDNGCGIPEEVSGQIFDPFFTTSRGKGSVGLGLHLAHSIVTNQLRGSIKLDTGIDTGCRFVITLPADLTD